MAIRERGGSSGDDSNSINLSAEETNELAAFTQKFASGKNGAPTPEEIERIKYLMDKVPHAKRDALRGQANILKTLVDAYRESIATNKPEIFMRAFERFLAENDENTVMNIFIAGISAISAMTEE